MAKPRPPARQSQPAGGRERRISAASRPSAVKGTARVKVEGAEKLVPSGESLFIKPGEKHRLANEGNEPLEIIEVQLGDYLEEDDVIRFDDDYGRI